MSNEVIRTYLELVSIKELINNNDSVSDSVAFESIASKCFLLAAASYFEKAVCQLIISHAENMSKSVTLVSFINKHALSRKYHTLFDWDKSNINKFIRYFGNDFTLFIEPRLSEEAIRAAIREFMFIGQARNELVHNNFSEYSLAVTFEDLKIKFDVAYPLIDFICKSLSEFEHSRGPLHG